MLLDGMSWHVSYWMLSDQRYTCFILNPNPNIESQKFDKKTQLGLLRECVGPLNSISCKVVVFKQEFYDISLNLHICVEASLSGVTC